MRGSSSKMINRDVLRKWYLILGIGSLLLAISSFRTTDKSSAKVRLGKTLFFDPILSLDSTLSCASCHKPAFAFADTIPFSIGVHGNKGLRNTPSVMNMSARSAFFWDGRAATLQAQVTFPMSDTNEMALPMALAIKRLTRSKTYRRLFAAAFHQLPNKNNIGLALAAFEKTLETSDTPNDRWLNGQKNALTEQQRNGRVVFLGKGQCAECHFTPDFTGDEYRSIGLFNGLEWNDSGRYKVTHRKSDIGKFKVPGLRNVAVTAPYMHDGSFKTLRQVIDFYNDPNAIIPHALNRDSLMLRPLHLTEREKQDLESFLHALTDDEFVKK